MLRRNSTVARQETRFAPRKARISPAIAFISGAASKLAIASATRGSRAPATPDERFAHACDSRVECVLVTVGDHRAVCSPQPAAADRRPRIRGVAPPSRTNLAPPVTSISSCWVLAVAEIVPDDDVGLATVERGCASRTTRGCRRKREKPLLAPCLWMLAQEPDVDPARVPEATGAPIGGHRRRDCNRLDDVGDQPSPSR